MVRCGLGLAIVAACGAGIQDGLAQQLERAEQRVKQKNLALLLSESRADAAERIAEKEMQEANEAKATAAKEKQDAVEAVAAAKKERGEAVEAR